MSATIGPGLLIVGAVTWNNSGGVTLSSVQDDQSNVYTVVDTGSDGTNPYSVASFYGYNVSGSPQTLRATFSASTPNVAIVADKYNGVTGTLNGHVIADQDSVSAGTNTVVAGPFTQTTGSLVYGVTGNSGLDSNPGAGGGFVDGIVNSSVITGNDFLFAESAASGGPSVTITFSPILSGDTWLTAGMAFPVIASTSSSSTGLMLLGCCN